MIKLINFIERSRLIKLNIIVSILKGHKKTTKIINLTTYDRNA